MVKWTCPWCGYIEYSAWERKEHKLVRCGRREGEYFNPYYEITRQGGRVFHD